MLCRPDARAGGISVTFTTAKARKSDRRAPGSKTAAADESDAEMLTTMPGGAKASEAAAAPFDPSPPPPTTTTTESASSAPPLPPRAASSSAAATASPSGLASSIGVYAGFYWWILVITAGIGPTLWSGMALAWHLGACPAAWLCLAASGLYWIIMTKVVPCDPENPPPWAARLAAYVLSRTVSFFAGFDVVLDEGAAEAMAGGGNGDGGDEKEVKGPFVVGLEPHSTLPMAAVLAFARFSPLGGRLPPALQGARLLASNACFAAPLVRHAWSWLGFAPASRRTMASLLATGTIGDGNVKASPPAAPSSSSPRIKRGCSVVLCPGGIREVLHLRKDRETIFLRSRRGFVRQALRAGAPLVPAFAFGQTTAFDWFPVLPSPPLPRALVSRLCRTIGFAPLWIHNGWLVPFPKRTAAMTLVIGKPLEFAPRRRGGGEVQSSTAAAAAAAAAAEQQEDASTGAPLLPSATFEVFEKNSSKGSIKRRGLFRGLRGGKAGTPSNAATSISSCSSSSSLSSSTSEAETDAASADNDSDSSSSIPVLQRPAFDFDEEDVDRYLAEFVEAMRDLYERHAPALGSADVPLTIL